MVSSSISWIVLRETTSMQFVLVSEKIQTVHFWQKVNSRCSSIKLIWGRFIWEQQILDAWWMTSLYLRDDWQENDGKLIPRKEQNTGCKHLIKHLLIIRVRRKCRCEFLPNKLCMVLGNCPVGRTKLEHLLCGIVCMVKAFILHEKTKLKTHSCDF